MPKIRAGRPRYLAELFRRYKKAQKMTSADIGRRVGRSPETVRAQLNKPTPQWRIGDLERYCAAMNIPMQEAYESARRELY